VDFTQHLDRADVLFDSKRWDMAIAEYQKYLAAEPNSDYAHGRIAMCLSNSDKNTEALDWCQRALQLNPEDEHLYYLHSFILQKMSKWAEANKSIQRAIEMEPDIGLYHAEASNCLLNLKKPKEADTESQIAVELEPDSEQVWYQRAIVLMSANKLKEAHEAVDVALSINPESMRSHGLKGTILGLEDKFTEAIRYYREALRINPNSEWARSGYMDALRGRSPAYKILVFFSTVRMPRFFFLNVYVLLALLALGLLLAVVAVLVKAISPHLLNVFLAFDPEGQQALDRGERKRAKLLGAYVLCSWIAGIWLMLHFGLPWAPSAFLLIYAGPILVTRIFEFSADTKYRRLAAGYAALGLTLGVASVVIAAFTQQSPWDDKTPTWDLCDTSLVLSFSFLVTCLFSRQFWQEHKTFF
jgi:tetratricopeptide (TPR) repeat protein